MNLQSIPSQQTKPNHPSIPRQIRSKLSATLPSETSKCVNSAVFRALILSSCCSMPANRVIQLPNTTQPFLPLPHWAIQLPIHEIAVFH